MKYVIQLRKELAELPNEKAQVQRLLHEANDFKRTRLERRVAICRLIEETLPTVADGLSKNERRDLYRLGAEATHRGGETGIAVRLYDAGGLHQLGGRRFSREGQKEEAAELLAMGGHFEKAAKLAVAEKNHAWAANLFEQAAQKATEGREQQRAIGLNIRAAEHALRAGNHRQAGDLFMLAKKHLRAIEAYRSGGYIDWVQHVKAILTRARAASQGVGRQKKE